MPITGSSTYGLATGDKEHTASYIVWVDGGVYYAKNGHTGVVTSNPVFSTLVNACIDALTTGGNIFFKAGTYAVAAAPVNLSGHTDIGLIGEEGTIFDIDSGITSAIYGAGAVSGAVTEVLTANAEINVVTVTVASTAGFAADNWVRLKSDDTVNPEYALIDKAEIKHIKSLIANTSITFTEQVMQQYTTANNAMIALCTPLKNITIRNITFLGDNPAGTQVAIQLVYGVNIKVLDCNFYDCGTTAIDLGSVVYSEVAGNYVKSSRTPGSGYGTCIEDASSNCDIHNNRWVDCRHGFCINSSENIGTCLYIHIHDNIAAASTGWGIDVHNVANYITIDNNICDGFTFSGADTYGSGIVTGANISYIRNNSIRGSQINATTGIQNRGVIYEVYIEGNSIENLTSAGGSHGIILSASQIIGGRICNNFIRDGYYGIRLSDFTCTSRMLISGNTFGVGTTYGIRLDNCDNIDIFDNQYLGTLMVEETNNPAGIAYSETIFVPFTEGTTFLSAAGAAWGWEIDATTEYAVAYIRLPSYVKSTVAFKVVGNSVIAETHGMLLTLTANGGAANELYNAEAVSVASKISTTQNFAATDYVEWDFVVGDDTDIDEYSAGDILQIKVEWSDTVGADIATDCILQGVEISYRKY